MIRRYPPSILIAVYLAVAAGLVFLLVSYLGDGLGWDRLLKFIAVVIFSLISVVVVLEIFVYQKLKGVDAAKESEIRKLKEVETFRREFLGDVSHELKTPIFAIQGFIETLLDGALEDKKVNRKFLQKAMKHSERLSHLVQDILVITQIESGDLAMHMDEFNLYEMVYEIVDSLETKFTKKGRNIECRILADGMEDTLAYADEERIQQVLYNLIDNAVKYGNSQGTILVNLEDNGEDKILVSITDNGDGIEPEHLARLFERFYRVDKSRSRGKGGTGLGLSICKHLIEAHKEKIWVESEQGVGTAFFFTLTKVQA